MSRWRLSAQFALLFLAFPLIVRADIAFGTVQSGGNIQCSTASNAYYGYDTVYLTRTTVTDPTGSPSSAFKAYVNNYSLSPGMTPTICVQFKPTYPGSYSAWVDAYYGYSNQYTAMVYVTGTYAPPSGWINPKYVVVGVMYSPPGRSSSVTYGNDTVVGSSTSVLSSFSSAYAKSTSLTASGNILGVVNASATTTRSQNYSQSLDVGSSIAINQSTSFSRTLSGFSDPYRGLNHDYDYIFVWLNPMLRFTAGDAYISWDGFGYDTADMPEMDVVGIQLGCLNGNFRNTSDWTACTNVYNGAFQRRWAMNNVDGSGPALTGGDQCVYGSGSDLCNIMAADPFSDPTYAINWPASGTYTTPDGRFTLCHGSCAQTISYQPYLATHYAETYSVTTSESQTAKRQYTETYAMSSSVSGTLFGTNYNKAMSSSTTLTWSEQFSSATNNSASQTASFSIVGPDPSYAGPIQFVIYQDNLYGTFVFTTP